MGLAPRHNGNDPVQGIDHPDDVIPALTYFIGADAIKGTVGNAVFHRTEECGVRCHLSQVYFLTLVKFWQGRKGRFEGYLYKVPP